MLHNSIELNRFTTYISDPNQLEELLNLENERLKAYKIIELNLADLCIFFHARIEAACHIIKMYQSCTSATILSDEQIKQIIDNSIYVYKKLFDSEINKHAEYSKFVKYYYCFSATFNIKTNHNKLDIYLKEIVKLSNKLEDVFYKHATPKELVHVFEPLSISKISFFNRIANVLHSNNKNHFKPTFGSENVKLNYI